MSSLFTSLWRTSDNSFVYRYKLINFELQKEEITTRVLELYRRTCSVRASPVWLKSTHHLYTMKFTLAPKHWWFLATYSIFKDSITRSILCSETNKNDKEKKKLKILYNTLIQNVAAVLKRMQIIWSHEILIILKRCEIKYLPYFKGLSCA